MLVLTRPAAQAAVWQQRLAERQVPSRVLPLVAVEPVPEMRAQARSAAAQADAVFFTSPAAVQALFADDGWRWPAAVPALCVGPGTAEALRAAGAAPVVTPPAEAAQFDSEALWPLLETQDWRERSLLWLRGEGGREWLMDRLRERGARLQALSVYRRSSPPLDAQQLALALRGPSLWLFSSSEALLYLAAQVPDLPARGLSALATHPRIAATAQQLGLQADVVAPQLPAIAEAWQRWRAGAQQPAP